MDRNKLEIPLLPDRSKTSILLLLISLAGLIISLYERISGEYPIS